MSCENCTHCQNQSQPEPNKIDILATPYDALPCRLSTFTINGIEADMDDFVDMECGYCECEDDCYGCHDMHAESLTLPQVREKLTGKELQVLTDEQIREVQYKLVDILCVGDCGWCA